MDHEEVVCGDCREPITLVEIDSRKEWRHTRTAAKKCAPICRECGAPAGYRIGFHGFDGAGARFITTGFVCEAHAPANAIVWT